ncbi:MAG: hypothetical protein DRN06_02615 [Thermoprotei archaeon]|nr:MAG: hypothetical protein DRN06_02615 [Thermoprotei archaeon]
MLERMEELKAYRALKACGLSSYEAKAYIALALQGPASARRIAETAGIPYTKVYDTLSKLERKGMVEVLPSRPMKYRALPPNEVAENIRTQLNQVASQAEEALIEELQPLYSLEVLEKPIVKLLKARRDMEAALKEIIDNANHEVVIHVGWADPSYLRSLLDRLRAAVKRGVKVKALTSPRYAKSDAITSLASLAELKLAKSLLPINVVVADGSEALFMLASKVREGRPSRRLTLRITLKELAGLIKEYTELAWETTSQSLEARGLKSH